MFVRRKGVTLYIELLHKRSNTSTILEKTSMNRFIIHVSTISEEIKNKITWFWSWFYNLLVASCELWVASYDFKKINLRVASSFFTSYKVILRVGNEIASCKLLFASCELLFTICKFKEIILWVASCVLWVENLKRIFLRVASCFLRVESLRW